MTQLTIFGLNMLLFMVVWRYMFQKSVLDRKRDHLFDLREEVRDYFLRNEIPLSSPIYKSIRDVLNRHIKVMEQVNFSRMFVYSTLLKKNPEISNYTRGLIEKKFETNNQELKKFLASIRTKASLRVTSYLIESSIIMLTFCSLLLICVVTSNGMKLLAKYCLKKCKKILPNRKILGFKLGQRHVTTKIFISYNINQNSFKEFVDRSSVEMRKHLIRQENVEQYSFRKAAQMRDENLQMRDDHLAPV